MRLMCGAGRYTRSSEKNLLRYHPFVRAPSVLLAAGAMGLLAGVLVMPCLKQPASKVSDWLDSLFLTVLWTYLDRSNLAFSALSFKQYLHLDNAQYGLGSGALPVASGFALFTAFASCQLPASDQNCKRSELLLCACFAERRW